MMTDNLHRLIYVSAAREEVSSADLERLLGIARRNNEAAGVTGLLLYHDGSFFQVLEGPKEAVVRIFSTVERDPRHSRVIVLQNKVAETRAFPNWSMGYMNAHALHSDQKANLVDLRQMTNAERPAELTTSAIVSTQINAFLGSFREFAAA